jgi:hypothetical protein
MVLKHERKPLGHAVMFLLVMLASSAISRESGILTRMLYASFLAEQGVAVCIVADPAFARETSGPIGYMRDYAQHVKAEVTAGLNESENPFAAEIRSRSRKGRSTARTQKSPDGGAGN